MNQISHTLHPNVTPHAADNRAPLLPLAQCSAPPSSASFSYSALQCPPRIAASRLVISCRLAVHGLKQRQ